MEIREPGDGPMSGELVADNLLPQPALKGPGPDEFAATSAILRCDGGVFVDRPSMAEGITLPESCRTVVRHRFPNIIPATPTSTAVAEQLLRDPSFGPTWPV